MSVTTNEEAQPIDFEGFAPITTTDGIGGGAKSDEVEFQVKKKLEGKTLEADAFTFQLIAPDGSVTEAKTMLKEILNSQQLNSLMKVHSNTKLKK